MKAEFESNGQTVEVDFSDMEKRLLDKLGGEAKKQMEQYMKEARDLKESGGKGVIEEFMPDDKKAKLLEEFHRGDNLDAQKIKEQWTVAVPRWARRELAPHLRDYCWVSDVIKGKPGETVNIPVIYDVEFQDVTPKTGTFTAHTDLVNVYTTTLHETGAYFDAYYGDIEKIDSNMLDELNRVFAHAAVRSEDNALICLLNTATSGEFNSKSGLTETVPMYAGTTNDTFDTSLVVDAIVNMMRRGKDVHPGELVLLLTPRLYGVLLKEIVGSTPLTQARPDTIQKGLIEDFLGVKLLISSKNTINHGLGMGAGTSYNMAYLMRPKRAIALAPKREILIETDKLIATRQLRIVASHTFGALIFDPTEVMPIKSNSAGGTSL
jgi:hypothetical protein